MIGEFAWAIIVLSMRSTMPSVWYASIAFDTAVRSIAKTLPGLKKDKLIYDYLRVGGNPECGNDCSTTCELRP